LYGIAVQSTWPSADALIVNPPEVTYVTQKETGPVPPTNVSETEYRSFAKAVLKLTVAAPELVVASPAL
jgi:hypothetical protein